MFLPDGAKNPLAMATDFIAWFNAPAPTAWISTLPFDLKTFANAPATELGFDFDETLSVSIIITLSLSILSYEDCLIDRTKFERIIT